MGRSIFMANIISLNSSFQSLKKTDKKKEKKIEYFLGIFLIWNRSIFFGIDVLIQLKAFRSKVILYYLLGRIRVDIF